ncbi:MAG: hypothetical protein IJ458_03865 [Clostridia bacterium]|nr:hypothetical protein [Clostridia bacterium]
MIKTHIKNRTEKIIINDFSKTNLQNKKLQSAIEGVQIYNFKNCNGVLEKGMGIDNFTTYAENDLNSFHYPLTYNHLGLEYINKVMHFKQYFSASGDTTHRLLIHGSDNKLYLFEMFSNLDRPNWVYNLQFDTIPAVLEYKKEGLDSILISSTDKLVVWSTGRTPYEITNIPTITSMCVYNDVLYCTIAGETDKIWYTLSLDPETVGVESDETKYLIMEGSAGGGRKIVMLRENMYVFCDYGIGKLNTYVKDKEATYNQIYLTDSQICPNTVIVCGDFVIFLTRDGLYKFNGTSVTKVDALQNQLEGSFNDYAVATHLQNYYYLATRLKFSKDELVGCECSNSDMKNNALIKLNLHDNSFEIIRGVDIKDMLALKAGIEEKIVLTFNTYHQNIIGEINDSGYCFDLPINKSYQTNDIIQKDMERITIRKVKFDSSKAVSVIIFTDEDSYTFNATREGVNEFKTIIACKKFNIKICANIADAYVNLVEIEYVRQD